MAQVERTDNAIRISLDGYPLSEALRQAGIALEEKVRGQGGRDCDELIVPLPPRTEDDEQSTRDFFAAMFPSMVGTTNHRSSIFSSEDTLSSFVNSLSEVEAGALYQLLHNAHGCRLDGHGVERWRKGR